MSHHAKKEMAPQDISTFINAITFPHQVIFLRYQIKFIGYFLFIFCFDEISAIQRSKM